MPDTLTQETRDQLKALLEDSVRSALDEDNVDAAIDAVLDRTSWNEVALRVAEDVLTEERTDALIVAFEPSIEALVEKLLGRLGFLAQLAGGSLTEHVKGVLDEMLPEVILDPLRDALQPEEPEPTPEP